MTAITPISAAVAASGRHTTAWNRHAAALAAVAAIILACFWRDAAEMAAIWWRSDTYNHCFLVPPIIGWLVWQRWPDLRQLQPTLWSPGLLLVAAGGLAWLLGEAGGLAVARHAGLVFMLQGAAITLLGVSVTRALAFPIFYALFMIPVGNEIVPTMQTLTAEMCMVLLDLVGIPAHIEGIFITIPNGYFRVAEACAGVKFLVAMIALGVLVANLCFRSWRRRALFIAASVVVPIVANGIRAWGIIYIAHVTDSNFAAGVDHVVYGWFFFAFVVALMIGGGWRFFDRAPDDPFFDPARLQPRPPTPVARNRLAAIAGGALLLAVTPLVWIGAVAASGAQAAPATIDLPAVAGWQRVSDQSGRRWEPHFAFADHIVMGRYRDARGAEVDLAIILFVRQEEGREMVGFGQGVAAPEGEWSWIAATPPPPSGRADRIASHGIVREVLTFYRVGEIVTGSKARVKLETMRTRLLGGPRRAIAIMVSAQAPAEGVSPRPALDRFVTALGDIGALADRAAAAED